MGPQPARNPTERELRSLDLKDFLELIREDIKELDELRRHRRKPDPEEKPKSGRKGRNRAEAPDLEPEEEEPPVPLSLHAVSCCGKKMGAFPGLARVRCPFCERWHRAGDFPLDAHE